MNFPLQSYNVLQSRDVDEVRERVSHAYCSHSLYLKKPYYQLDTRHHRVSFGGISINYLQYGADVEIISGGFERFFMFEIPLSGTARIKYGEDRVKSARNIGSVVSPTKSMHSEWSADAKRLMVQIDRNVMERFVSSIVGHALNKPLDFRLAFDMNTGLGAGLRAYVEYLIGQLSDYNYFEKYPLVRKEVERTLLTMLVNGQVNNYSEEIKAVEAPGAPRPVQRAYEYIMENYAEDIGIEDLVAISGLSARALFAGFKRYKGVSPMVAIKTRRLHAVQADLLDAGPEDTVTSIAYKWGFTHLGNFARDYHNLFGEKPSSTLRKLQ